MKNKIIASLLAVPLLLAGCSNAGSKPVMTVGDVEVSGGIYESYLNSYMGSVTAEEAKDMVLEQCKANFTVVAVAEAMGIEFDDSTKSDIKKAKKHVVDGYNSNYNGKYKGFLKDNNLTDKDLDKMIAVSYYAQELRKKFDGVEYTDDDKRQFFKDNYRRAKHILIMADEEMTDEDKEAAKVKAEELLEKAKNGENFDTLVTENSEDPGSISSPDGYFFTDGAMVKEFQDGVDSIAPGEFTLVKSTYGYHVIQRLALDDNAELFETEYEKVADELESKMISRSFEKQVYAWADEYGIEVDVDEDAVDEIIERVNKQYEETRKSLEEKNIENSDSSK
ncbi:MAG: peptidylprolyl isomerase [Oscillospiraceae bacterium]|nr:peptidylprolyl isomerase [Oscillospiraceae bacterium]